MLRISVSHLRAFCYQTSSRLHKTVIDYDYDYFQFMKDDYDYIFNFARGITITIMIIHFLKF